jgi:hypothetical protein
MGPGGLVFAITACPSLEESRPLPRDQHHQLGHFAKFGVGVRGM